jgi:hypothetical protein
VVAAAAAHMFSLLWNFDMATSGPGGRYAWTNGPGFGCAVIHLPLSLNASHAIIPSHPYPYSS